MPTRKVPGGYKWGSKGKVYPTKAHASGYKKPKRKGKK